MRINLSICLVQYILLGCQYNFHQVKAMTGPSVRLAIANEYPYVVSLIRVSAEDVESPNAEYVCTGALITRIDVATAATCTVDQPGYAVRVSVGSIDFREGRRYDIEWWIIYDNWAVFNGVPIDFDENDVAHIRMKNPVPHTMTTLPVFNLQNHRLYNQNTEMVSWSVPNGSELDVYLKTATVNVLSTRDCLRRIHRLVGAATTMDKRQTICTVSNPHAVFTEGDIGGPLIHNGKLAGIHTKILPHQFSFGHPLAINAHLAISYYKIFFDSNSDFNFV